MCFDVFVLCKAITHFCSRLSGYNNTKHARSTCQCRNRPFWVFLETISSSLKMCLRVHYVDDEWKTKTVNKRTLGNVRSSMRKGKTHPDFHVWMWQSWTFSVAMVTTASLPPREVFACAGHSGWITAVSMTDRPRSDRVFFWAPYRSASEHPVYVPNSSITIRPHTGSGPALTRPQELSQWKGELDVTAVHWSGFLLLSQTMWWWMSVTSENDERMNSRFIQNIQRQFVRTSRGSLQCPNKHLQMELLTCD